MRKLQLPLKIWGDYLFALERQKRILELLAQEPTLKGVFVKNMLKKLEAADDKEAVNRALNIGLRAFNTEVKYNED